MTKFEWTTEQRAKLVPGAKVIVTFPNCTSWDPVFYSVRRLYSFAGVDYVIFNEPCVSALMNENCSRNAVHRLEHCDPSTIEDAP